MGDARPHHSLRPPTRRNRLRAPTKGRPSMSIERVRRALTGISGVHVTPYDSSGAIDAALLGSIVADMAVSGGPNNVSARNTREVFAPTTPEGPRRAPLPTPPPPPPPPPT